MGENGEWRKMQNEILSLYRLRNVVRIIMKIKMDKAYSLDESRWEWFQILTGKPAGRRPLGRRRSR